MSDCAGTGRQASGRVESREGADAQSCVLDDVLGLASPTPDSGT